MIMSWCEVEISGSHFTHSGCSVCYTSDGKITVRRLFNDIIEPLSMFSEEDLKLTIDVNGNFYVRSLPLPLARRDYNGIDDCRKFAISVTSTYHLPVRYFQHIPFNDHDGEVIDEIRYYDNAHAFKISERPDTGVDIVEIDGKQYLRLWINLISPPFIDTVLDNFYHALPERWFE